MTVLKELGADKECRMKCAYVSEALALEHFDPECGAASLVYLLRAL
jgi:hypothetical protein